MHEVYTSAAAVLLRAAARAGVEAEPALAHLGDPDRLDEPGARIGWSTFVEFVEALDRAAGKAARFDTIVREAIVGSPRLEAAIDLFEDPVDLYRFFGTLFLPAHLRPLRVEFETGDKAGDYRLIAEVASPHRASSALFRVVGATLRWLPGLYGLDPADVKAEIHERGAAFTVKAPRKPKTKSKRAAQAANGDVRSLVEAAFVQAVRTNRALEEALRQARDGEERLERVRALGTSLGRARDLAELGAVVADTLRGPPFVCGSVALSLVDHGAEHALVRAGEMTPGAVVRAQPLRLGDREIARLETSGFLSETRPDALDDLVPLLTVAIDRLTVTKALKDQLLSSRPPEEGPSEEALHRRLARSAGEWQLTPRQLACVERLVRGRSNREIARDIGCTERTVEAHLAVVFRRAGVRARSSLVARFWSEAW